MSRLVVAGRLRPHPQVQEEIRVRLPAELLIADASTSGVAAFEVDHSSEPHLAPFMSSRGARILERTPLMAEMQGPADGVLAMNGTARDSNASLTRPRDTTVTSSSAGGDGDTDTRRHSSQHTDSALLIKSPTPRISTTELIIKTAPTPRISTAELQLRRGNAPSPLPVTVQERDSGAQVIHTVEYVPPAYDATLPHSAAAVPVSPTDATDDDPNKRAGLRPLPTLPPA